jgi:phenylacetate-CoA ligase
MMTELYGSFYRKALMPAWESVIRKRPTLSYLHRLEQSQWYSLDELHALELQELKKLVSHAYTNVPYYKRRFRELGFESADLKTLDDLELLPLLGREDAMGSLEERQANGGPRVEIKKMTSGSTGQPLQFGYDRNSEHWRQATRLRGYSWAGYLPGEPALHYWGALDSLYATNWKVKLKRGIDRGLRRDVYADSTPRSPEDLARVVKLIEKKRPRSIICFAQAGAALARYIVETGCRRWDDIRVICGAERLFDADRHALQQAFGPHVFETYGSREVMLIGSECPAHAGLHTSMENLIVEILVRDGGRMRRAEPGETGEVAITDLHNYALPFIRYLTGDLATWHPPVRCACGRALQRLRSIEGRKNDTLHDASGNAVDALFFNVMFSVLADKVRHFQAVQHKDGTLDLRIVPTGAFDQQVLSSVKNNCSKFLKGIDTRVHLVDQIPVDKNGKLRVVVVEH